MTAGPFIIEALADHVRATFTCGSEPLDRYFRERVSQDIRRHIANCFVAVDDAGTIAGYYTLAATGIPITELPPEEAKRLPRYPLLPAALIGRLAVDQRFAGQGLGSALILDAVEKAGRSEPAIFCLVVDAKDEKAVSFYRHLGFRQFASKPISLFIPVVEAARQLAAAKAP